MLDVPFRSARSARRRHPEEEDRRARAARPLHRARREVRRRAERRGRPHFARARTRGPRGRSRAGQARRLGPADGVPMTIKESYDVAGLPTTWGVPTYKTNVATRNAVVVDRLLGAGAVLFGKTNVPLFLADWQSFNAIYGTTNNPWDLTRSPGGSSGGSAARSRPDSPRWRRAATSGSSIRNPAHFCGVYGHKADLGHRAAHGPGAALAEGGAGRHRRRRAARAQQRRSRARAVRDGPGPTPSTPQAGSCGCARPGPRACATSGWR